MLPQDVAGLLQLLLLGEVPPDLLLDVEDGSPRLLLLLHRDDVAAVISGQVNINMYGTCNVNRESSQAGNDASCHAGSCPLSL